MKKMKYEMPTESEYLQKNSIRTGQKHFREGVKFLLFCFMDLAKQEHICRRMPIPSNNANAL